MSATMAPAPPATVIAWLGSQDTETLFLSTVTIAEIGYGLGILPAGRRRRELETRFDAFLARGFDDRILTFDLSAAAYYAAIMVRRRALGPPMSVPDAQIAAIAASNGLSLATCNLTNFEDCGSSLINPFDGLPQGA